MEGQKMRNFKLISVEGVDGVGKTSLAKKLAERISGAFFTTPFRDLPQIYSQIESTDDGQTRFLYFLMCNSFLSNKLNTVLEKRHVITDRYIYSTLAYHSVIWKSQNVEKIVESLNLRMPDIIVYLYINDEETRWQRLQGRDITLCDLKFKGKIDQVDAYYKHLLREDDNINIVAIENSDMKIDELIDKAVNSISKYIKIDMNKSNAGGLM
jgi:thymidylate kinase